MKASYITPAVTLFREDGGLDFESNGRLYEHLISSRMDGILVLGSIGEFFALPLDMRRQMADFAVQTVKGRTRLFLGTGGMQYGETASFSNECLEKGADAVVVMPPYFFPLDDDTVYDYYHRLARDVRGPVLIYNFPERMGYSLSVEVIRRLAEEHPSIVGVKDSVPGMNHTRELIGAIKPLRPDFEIYSGYDDNLAANALAGGDGCISGLSNIFPGVCAAWTEAIRKNDPEGMALGQRRINRLFSIYSITKPFVPGMKEALRVKGIARSARCTFPLGRVTEAQAAEIRALMDETAAWEL